MPEMLFFKEMFFNSSSSKKIKTLAAHGRKTYQPANRQLTK